MKIEFKSQLDFLTSYVSDVTAPEKTVVDSGLTLPSTKAIAIDFSKPKKKKVLVIGTIGQQRDEIQREFENKFKLFFISSDHVDSRHDLIRSHGSSAELVVYMRKFMSHEAYHCAKRYGKDRLEIANGGCESVKTILSTFAGRFE